VLRGERAFSPARISHLRIFFTPIIRPQLGLAGAFCSRRARICGSGFATPETVIFPDFAIDTIPLCGG
jgi:hypothetical protein